MNAGITSTGIATHVLAWPTEELLGRAPWLVKSWKNAKEEAWKASIEFASVK